MLSSILHPDTLYSVTTLTFPAGGAVALDDPECLLQLVAVGEQIKEALSVVGTVAQVYGDISGSNTSLAVRHRKPEYIHRGFTLYKSTLILIVVNSFLRTVTTVLVAPASATILLALPVFQFV